MPATRASVSNSWLVLVADLTSAQRLAAYRDELRTAGFGEEQVAHLVGIAAPRVEDIEIQADLDDPGEMIGEVKVRLKAELDKDDIARLVERVQAYVNDASR